MTKRALIVDDDPISLCLAGDLFEARGWHTVRAMTVAEAHLAAKRFHSFDLFVIDDHLPDGGFDDIVSAWPQLPFVARVSGAESPKETKNDWNIFLAKPWTEDVADKILSAYAHPKKAQRNVLRSNIPSRAQLPLFDQDACRKAFAKHPGLWFRVREGVNRRLPVLLQEIGASSERRDRLSFQHLAHEIGGMLKMLRSQALAEHAGRMERLAESAQWDRLCEELGYLNASLPQLEARLDDFGREFCPSMPLGWGQ